MPGQPWIVEVEIDGQLHRILDTQSADPAGARARVVRDAVAAAGGVTVYAVHGPDGAELHVRWGKVGVWRVHDQPRRRQQ